MSFEKMNTDKVLVSFTFFAPWRHLSGLCPSDADKEWLNIACYLTMFQLCRTSCHLSTQCHLCAIKSDMMRQNCSKQLINFAQI